jgi:DNA-directed RNA polymerase
LYQYVADDTVREIRKLKGAFSPNWENVIKTIIDRQVVKRVVMTIAYNVTYSSALLYIKENYVKDVSGSYT